jgi:hypothetical protein
MAAFTTFYDNSGTGLSGVTSGTAQQWSSMEVGPLTSGHDYAALLSYRLTNSNVNAAVGLHQGASFGAASLIAEQYGLPAGKGTTTAIAKFTASAANQVYVSLRSAVGANSVSVTDGMLLLLDLTELGSNNWAYDSESSSSPGTSYVDGASVTLPSAGDWLIIGQWQWSNPGSTQKYIDIYDGSTSRSESAISNFNSSGTYYGSGMTSYYAAGASASTVFTVRHRSATSAGYTFVDSRILAIRVSASANVAVSQQTTTYSDDAGAGYSTVTNAANSTFEPLATRNHVVLWAARDMAATGEADARYARLRDLDASANLHTNIADVQTQGYINTDGLSNGYILPWSGTRASGGPIDLAVQLYESGTGSATSGVVGDFIIMDTELADAATIVQQAMANYRMRAA